MGSERESVKCAFYAAFRKALFPLRRPPEQHILDRMADKPGASMWK